MSLGIGHGVRFEFDVHFLKKNCPVKMRSREYLAKCKLTEESSNDKKKSQK
jgi:hypothetical protein